VSGLDDMIRELIRAEIRRLIRPDALAANDDVPVVDSELEARAKEVARRFRRVRAG
jgi:hypothetical protein